MKHRCRLRLVKNRFCNDGYFPFCVPTAWLRVRTIWREHRSYWGQGGADVDLQPLTALISLTAFPRLKLQNNPKVYYKHARIQSNILYSLLKQLFPCALKIVIIYYRIVLSFFKLIFTLSLFVWSRFYIGI